LPFNRLRSAKYHPGRNTKARRLPGFACLVENRHSFSMMTHVYCSTGAVSSFVFVLFYFCFILLPRIAITLPCCLEMVGKSGQEQVIAKGRMPPWTSYNPNSPNGASARRRGSSRLMPGLIRHFTSFGLGSRGFGSGSASRQMH
jgi:hypothetical protein